MNTRQRLKIVCLSFCLSQCFVGHNDVYLVPPPIQQQSMGVASCGQRVMKTLTRHAFTVQEWHNYILHNGGLRCSSSLSHRMCPHPLQSVLTEPFAGSLLLVPGYHTEWVAVAGTRLSYRVGCCCWYQAVTDTEWVAVAGTRLSYRVGCCCWYQAVIQSGLLLLVPACHTERVAVAGTSLSYRICCCCWY